jgi:NTE family protein
MKKNVTLVLSGGGARGFAHIGAIEEIESRGYEICSIAGTSMGALVGGVYATGKLNEFKEWAYNLDKQKIFKLIDFSFTNQGLIKGDRVLKTMKKFIPDANIEDLKIKYTATACDMAQNKEVVFREGSLYNAIRASISIPTVFTPVVSGNMVLVDGES